MQPLDTPTKTNIAARMGAWSATHRKRAILGWIGFVLASLVLGMGVFGMRMLTPADSQTGESAQAARAIAKTQMGDMASESVLVSSARYRAGDPQFRRTLGELSRSLRAQPHVSGVRTSAGNAEMVSRDGHSALVQFQLSGTMMQTMDRVAKPLAAVAAVQGRHPGFRVEEFGDASFQKASTDSAGKDFSHAESLSIPVTLLILVLAFGAFVAAVLPVLLALSAFAAAMGLVFVASHWFPIDHSTFSVMLLIGMAVGVDYSLFYIRREREERAAGRSSEAALRAAAATSGHSVLISGLTVMVAVGGLFLAGTGTFRGVAAGTILVVATSIVGSLTVLPAVLSKLGDRIESVRIPGLKRRGRGGESRIWNRILTPVLRRPAISAAAATAFLVVLAIPALSMHTIQPSFDDYPQSMPILATYKHLQREFPGGPAPAQVVVKTGDVSSKQFAQAVAQFRAAALETGELHQPITVRSITPQTAVISVPLAGAGEDKASMSALHTLRSEVIPATLGSAHGVTSVAVGGTTASASDYNATLASHVPLVFAFVLGLAFMLLLWTFRSVVIALKAIVLNLLSVGAAYGFLVAMFQWGWGQSLLGFHSNHGIAVWIPLFLFVVLFGLSMDYHVFIISRIREAVDRGETTEDAVSHGIRTTAGVVTSAAFVMVAVFSIFGSLSQVSMKEIGMGLAVAVLLDATVVRGVLLPASMKLLGEWNWWLPRPLKWLGRTGSAHGEARVPREPVGVTA
jgi:uncharacterized membrane protein YdfJ with MMPL/SSD domain